MYTNHPCIRIIKNLPKVEANVIRSEAYRDAFSKVDGDGKRHLQSAVKKLSKIPNLGEIYTVELLAAIGQYLDSIDWPPKEEKCPS